MRAPCRLRRQRDTPLPELLGPDREGPHEELELQSVCSGKAVGGL